MNHKKELLRGLWVEIKVGLSNRRRGLVAVVVVAVAVVSSSTCRSVVLVILLVFVIVLALAPALALVLAAVSVAAAAAVRYPLGPLVLLFSNITRTTITMNSSSIYCTHPCPCCLVTRAGVERCTLTVQAFGPLALGPSASDLKGVLPSSFIPRSSSETSSLKFGQRDGA